MDDLREMSNLMSRHETGFSKTTVQTNLTLYNVFFLPQLKVTPTRRLR